MRTREPDFSQLHRVLRREKPERPVLFELFMNWKVYERFGGLGWTEDGRESTRRLIHAFAAGGYDYASTAASAFGFPTNAKPHAQTTTLNGNSVITDWASFEQYRWPDPEAHGNAGLDHALTYMPEGMKLMIMGPGGVLENVISLMGYDNLCFAVYEEPELVRRVFEEVGSRLVKYYAIAAPHPAVGMIMSNDDWGFNTQTMLSPAHMREYVFPWHRKIVETAHRYGKPIALHSCGCLTEVMDDIIGMGYDAKHSYEDNIMPVEECYRRWGDRIAILGGVDMDFLVRAPVEAIRQRCLALLAMGERGYALGSGNSIPEYVPDEKYDAMRAVALEG